MDPKGARTHSEENQKCTKNKSLRLFSFSVVLGHGPSNTPARAMQHRVTPQPAHKTSDRLRKPAEKRFTLDVQQLKFQPLSGIIAPSIHGIATPLSYNHCFCMAWRLGVERVPGASRKLVGSLSEAWRTSQSNSISAHGVGACPPGFQSRPPTPIASLHMV